MKNYIFGMAPSIGESPIILHQMWYHSVYQKMENDISTMIWTVLFHMSHVFQSGLQLIIHQLIQAWSQWILQLILAMAMFTHGSFFFDLIISNASLLCRGSQRSCVLHVSIQDGKVPQQFRKKPFLQHYKVRIMKFITLITVNPFNWDWSCIFIS